MEATKNTHLIMLVLATVSNLPHAAVATKATVGRSDSAAKITVRTESYPRPPYSGATYYFYEKDDQLICTKLEVCNKFSECTTDYKKGWYKDQQDTDPFEKTPATVIPREKQGKHRCLTKYGLLK
ncbi:hypothetical protein [Nitrosomonas sp.]|uniref:hypothetical protein n=1 Tax=Nitrosomonas sp. TaxID=42353 RepID=UPI0025CC3CEF|nr:hypothetical protein [Nitrosomonas sp.]MCC6916393.1 hypothetical protein [Nitrosomonas sp.]